MNAATASKITMSSTFCGPFLEENDVSGWVVKSIYAKDQNNDGQTKRTWQIIEPFAAVRTELKTASDLSEELPSKSSSTSLDSYDLEICYNKYLAYYKIPLLREPQTINSFKQHLTQNNAKHLTCY